MNCTYTYKIGDQEVTTSFKELIEQYKEGANGSDVVFSLTESEKKQDLIYDKINRERVSAEVVGVSEDADEPTIRKPNTISCVELPNDENFVYGSRKLTRKFDKEQRIKNKAREYMADSSLQLTKEQAIEKATKDVENWNIIRDDSKVLHKAVTDYDGSDSKFLDNLSGTKFEDVAGDLYSSIKSVTKGMLKDMKDISLGTSSKILYNVNLECELEGFDKKLIGHIDQLIIDGNGNVHIVLYKIATSPLIEGSDKMENYRYQMFLLKQMLANKGVDVRNATLHIVPIRVKYNEDYSKVESAAASRVIELTRNKRGALSPKKYEEISEYFIKGNISVDRVVGEDIDIAQSNLDLLFPDRKIMIQGAQLSAEEWIKNNRSKIIPSNKPGVFYNIEFSPSDRVEITDPTVPTKNEQIINEVKSRQRLLSVDNDTVINDIITRVKSGIEKGRSFFKDKSRFGKSAGYLQQIFGKYFLKDGDEKSEWKMIDNDILNSAGILLFLNSRTKQLDVVSISNFNLNTKVSFRKGDTILGCHLKNMSVPGQSINYKSSFGNIEMMKSMFLLNQVLPKIEGDFLLGKLQVISLVDGGQGIPFNMDSINKECFFPTIDFLNKFPGTKIQNNFTKMKFSDKLTLLENEYAAIMEDPSTTTYEQQTYQDLGFEKLKEADSRYAKLKILREIEKAMRAQYAYLQGPTSNIHNTKVGKLYKKVLEAIQFIDTGKNVSVTDTHQSTFMMQTSVSSIIPNQNVEMITSQLSKTINKVADMFQQKWGAIRKIFFEYYDAVGYTRLQNSVIGGQETVFRDLYLKDARGNRTLRLLNPYDANDMAQINPSSHRDAKQKFLKKVLFEFAKIRYNKLGIDFSFKDCDDPDLLEFIDQHSDTYFNIPLERASVSTRRTKLNVTKKAKRVLQNLRKMVTNPNFAIDYFVEKVDTDEEAELRDKSVAEGYLRDKFMIGDNTDSRDSYIAQYGEDFFETNLENLLADYAEQDIENEQYNNFLITVKSVIMQLEILKGNPNMKKITEQAIDRIEQFIKTNVFHKSIMDKSSKAILGFLAPLKRLVSHLMVAGNVVGSVRDTFEGVWQNTMRTINKYQTDLTYTSLTRAYNIVMKGVFTDGRSVTVLTQLNQMFRISNIDVSRISEGVKSERGATNIADWCYATLRRPDFLNRMSLFVARCVQDGVYDAFSIVDGELKYDWKKDKRFSVFADKSKEGTKEYYDQMGAYYNAIREYNKEHPENQLTYQDDLPMPYTNAYVESIKNVAATIYGSYDVSTKAGYESMALGFTFGMFTTWLNGIHANWLAKPGSYSMKEVRDEHQRDASGNYLYFDSTGRIAYKNEQENKYYYQDTQEEVPEGTIVRPVIEKVPVPIQGIIYTIGDIFRCARHSKNWGEFKETFAKEFWYSDDIDAKNLRKLLSDLLAWVLFGSLCTFALNPAYSDYKKEHMSENSPVVNGLVEVFYKGFKSSYENFSGMYALVDQIGTKTSNLTYTQNVNLIKNLCSTMFGDKTTFELFTDTFATTRSVKDTLRHTEYYENKKEEKRQRRQEEKAQG